MLQCSLTPVVLAAAARTILHLMATQAETEYEWDHGEMHDLAMYRAWLTSSRVVHDQLPSSASFTR